MEFKRGRRKGREIGEGRRGARRVRDEERRKGREVTLKLVEMLAA
jgi:hypothetical protein